MGSNPAWVISGVCLFFFYTQKALNIHDSIKILVNGKNLSEQKCLGVMYWQNKKFTDRLIFTDNWEAIDSSLPLPPAPSRSPFPSLGYTTATHHRHSSTISVQGLRWRQGFTNVHLVQSSDRQDPGHRFHPLQSLSHPVFFHPELVLQFRLFQLLLVEVNGLGVDQAALCGNADTLSPLPPVKDDTNTSEMHTRNETTVRTP